MATKKQQKISEEPLEEAEDNVLEPDLDPDDFELDEWLEGASPTHRSVDVYAAGDLVAERDALERQIQALESPKVRALGGNPADDLRHAWREITERIIATKLTVVVQAIDSERIRKITEEYRKEHKIKDEWMPVGRSAFDPVKLRKWDNEGQQNACVRAAIVALITPSGKRREPAFRDDEQLDKFIDKIGPAQWGAISNAFDSAISESPVVGADFSPESSSDDDGEES